MALAIKMGGLVSSRAVKDYAELARLGNVSRARVTQIMNLNLLAPGIQGGVAVLAEDGARKGCDYAEGVAVGCDDFGLEPASSKVATIEVFRYYTQQPMQRPFIPVSVDIALK